MSKSTLLDQLETYLANGGEQEHDIFVAEAKFSMRMSDGTWQEMGKVINFVLPLFRDSEQETRQQK